MTTNNPDPNHPNGPESFFHFYGATHVQTRGWVNLPAYTIEELYQAFKQRLKKEIFEDFDDVGEEIVWEEVPLPVDGKRKGRPKGSKNKKRNNEVTVSDDRLDTDEKPPPFLAKSETGQDFLNDCPF